MTRRMTDEERRIRAGQLEEQRRQKYQEISDEILALVRDTSDEEQAYYARRRIRRRRWEAKKQAIIDAGRFRLEWSYEAIGVVPETMRRWRRDGIGPRPGRNGTYSVQEYENFLVSRPDPSWHWRRRKFFDDLMVARIHGNICEIRRMSSKIRLITERRTKRGQPSDVQDDRGPETRHEQAVPGSGEGEGDQQCGAHQGLHR